MLMKNKYPYYVPMKDSTKYMKATKDYLKSVDKKYGTQFTVQPIKKAGDIK